MLRRGITYVHEHILYDASRYSHQREPLYAFGKSVRELRQLYQWGVRNIVDLTPLEFGRNLAYLEAISLASGIRIIPSIGFSQPSEYQNWQEEDFSKRINRELRESTQGTQIKARVIGEITISGAQLTEFERSILGAAVQVSLEKGSPILCHVNDRRVVRELLTFLQSRKMNFSRCALVGLHFEYDPQWIISLLHTGVFVQFDVVRGDDTPNYMQVIHMLHDIAKAGRQEQVLVSMHIHSESQLKESGGVGYSYLLQEFAGKLESNFRVGGKYVEMMLVYNPWRLFKAPK
ncbi:hypothetical protein PVA45_02355 [Entomospira entomophila]|uniref:Phosphotriesterase-related protein n=1 Tax=Entomospira entomophila TaxID=2719988 RepID=A0A968GDC5_9SPIO|nr:hypothetical protein [Entomospira entomophilus]NIZ40354.1 hypothetical protein [Entomospira entomophilus]WDI35913.1 hypothetical protein PVA45_02355 [Entomospira entomophilus]